MEARLRAFLDFLEPRKVKEGEAFTHTSKANQYQISVAPIDICRADCRNKIYLSG